MKATVHLTCSKARVRQCSRYRNQVRTLSPVQCVISRWLYAALRWQWSGAFTLTAREDYFGLRVRHTQDPERAVNIPVNITVGPTGACTTSSNFLTMST